MGVGLGNTCSTVAFVCVTMWGCSGESPPPAFPEISYMSESGVLADFPVFIARANRNFRSNPIVYVDVVAPITEESEIEIGGEFEFTEGGSGSIRSESDFTVTRSALSAHNTRFEIRCNTKECAPRQYWIRVNRVALKIPARSNRLDRIIYGAIGRRIDEPPNSVYLGINSDNAGKPFHTWVYRSTPQPLIAVFDGLDLSEIATRYDLDEGSWSEARSNRVQIGSFNLEIPSDWKNNRIVALDYPSNLLPEIQGSIAFARALEFGKGIGLRGYTIEVERSTPDFLLNLEQSSREQWHAKSQKSEFFDAVFHGLQEIDGKSVLRTQTRSTHRFAPHDRILLYYWTSDKPTCVSILDFNLNGSEKEDIELVDRIIRSVKVGKQA